MKNSLKISTIILFLLVVVSCQPETTIADGVSFSDVTYVTLPKPNANNNIIQVREGEEISFRDLSKGGLSRNWEMSDGFNAKLDYPNTFLKNGFGTIGDTTDISNFIRNEVSISDQTAFAYFAVPNEDPNIVEEGEEPSLSFVKFTSTFKDAVTFSGDNQLDITLDKISEEEYVFTKIFKVDVVADIIGEYEVYLNDVTEPIYVYKFGETIVPPRDQWLELSLNIGDSLRFVNTSTIGRHNATDWLMTTDTSNIQGEEFIEQEEITITYNEQIIEPVSPGLLLVVRDISDTVTREVSQRFRTLIPLALTVN